MININNKLDNQLYWDILKPLSTQLSIRHSLFNNHNIKIHDKLCRKCFEQIRIQHSSSIRSQLINLLKNG
jgi:hypothetical protein